MKVLIAGGGTACHINPGIAIAKYIKQKEPDTEIMFIGTQRGLEMKLVPIEGFLLRTIKVKGFKRKLSVDTIIAVKELFQGLAEARKVIKEFKPDFVIGTGGYVCGPVIFMASRMKIPTVIHESNAFPGVTNKILSRFTDAVAISFEESLKYLKSSKKVVLTGNPIRVELLQTDKEKARRKLGIDAITKVVVIVGGSLGAAKINKAVVEMLCDYYKSKDFKIIFATGQAQYDSIIEELGNKKPVSAEVVPYIYDAAAVYSAADLIVCRAGAITSSEITALGLPSVLIPSPYVTANHQEYNARAVESKGGAVLLLEKDLNGEVLYKTIIDLVNNKEKLDKMSENAKRIGIKNATEIIYSLIADIRETRKKISGK